MRRIDAFFYWIEYIWLQGDMATYSTLNNPKLNNKITDIKRKYLLCFFSDIAMSSKTWINPKKIQFFENS